MLLQNKKNNSKDKFLFKLKLLQNLIQYNLKYLYIKKFNNFELLLNFIEKTFLIKDLYKIRTELQSILDRNITKKIFSNLKANKIKSKLDKYFNEILK